MGGDGMILGEVLLPQNKFELLKRLQSIKDVQFKIIENVEKKDLSKVSKEVGTYLSNKEATIVVIKNTR